MSHSERGKRKLELLVQLILERSFQVTFYGKLQLAVI